MAKSKKNKITQEIETIQSFKGFNQDLTCRNFQFEIGKTFTHDGDVEACEGGFHACEYPLDVFKYYAPATSRYCTVEQSGDLSRDGDDSKVASRSITIKAEIELPFIIKAAIEWTMSKCGPVDPQSPAFNEGEKGLASNSGDYGAASNSGTRGAASNSGDYGAASNSGYRGAASNSGDYGVAAGFGYENKAKSSETGAIVLVYRNDDGELIHIRASKVGENGIKADTWYQLNEGGEFIEVDE